MADVSSVISHFPSAVDGFTTTLGSSISAGATTVPLNSVTGYSNGDVVVLIVDPGTAAKKQTFTGVVDVAGIQITNVVWTTGTNQTHSAGATVVDYETATHWAMTAKGMKVGHEQDGTHKASLPLTTPVLTSPSVKGLFDGWTLANDTWTYASATTITVPTGAASKYSVGDKIKLTQTTVKYFYITGVADTVLTINGGSDYTLTNAAISANYYSHSVTPVGFPGEFNYTPTWTNLTLGNGTVVATFSMSGKDVRCRGKLTLGSTTSMSGGGVQATLPVTMASGYANDELFWGDGTCLDTGNAVHLAKLAFGTTTTVYFRAVTSTAGTNPVYIKSDSAYNVDSTHPFAWGTGDVLGWYMNYKAA